jgi:hypothetical protein
MAHRIRAAILGGHYSPKRQKFGGCGKICLGSSYSKTSALFIKCGWLSPTKIYAGRREIMNGKSKQTLFSLLVALLICLMAGYLLVCQKSAVKASKDGFYTAFFMVLHVFLWDE